MGLAAPRHVGSFQTRDWTCVPCIGRRILNHCATREVPDIVFHHLQKFHLVLSLSLHFSHYVYIFLYITERVQQIYNRCLLFQLLLSFLGVFLFNFFPVYGSHFLDSLYDWYSCNFFVGMLDIINFMVQTVGTFFLAFFSRMFVFVLFLIFLLK